MNLKTEIKLSDLVRRSGSVKKGGASKAPRGEVVGLKIGASQLAASRVANNGSARLLQLARGPLPSGIVVAGEVRDIPALAAALNEFFRVHKLPRRGVRLGVATNRIGVRSFELAGIDDEQQLENAIRFRAHDALSIPVDDQVLDYHVVSESLDDSGQTVRRVVLAAAYRDSIDRYVAACKQAGIEVVAVDLEAFALLRTVAPALAGDAPAAVVAVTIGHDRTTLAISDGTVCDFTRVLEWGGSSLDAVIEREVGIGASEAAELKRAMSLETADSLGADADDRKSARARDAVRRELQSLARDLVNSLQFYQTQPGSLAISEILLAGGTSRLNGLPEELERLTHVRVRRADPLARVQVADAVESRDDLPSLAVAIGLGIEVWMRAVNLLPTPRVEQRQDDGQRRGRMTKAVAAAAGLLLVFVTAVLGFAFVREHSAVKDRQSILTGLQAKVAQTHAAAASSAAAAAATQAQITAITSAASGRIEWDALLNQLSRVMPSGASLVSLQASDGNGTSPASTPSTSSSSTPSTSTTTSSAPASSLTSSTTGSASAPTSFVITGYAVSQATVAQVLDRLALIPALSDVSLQSTQRANVAPTNTNAAANTSAMPTNAVQFTIGANLRSAGGTPQ